MRLKSEAANIARKEVVHDVLIDHLRLENLGPMIRTIASGINRVNWKMSIGALNMGEMKGGRTRGP